MKASVRLAGFLVALPFSLAGAAADNAAEAMLARAGGDGLGYLRIERPVVALGKMDGITRKLGGRVGDLLPLVAQRFLKNPMLAGVDLQRPCTVIFLNPAQFTNDLAIVVGVSDEAMFCDRFGKGGVSRVEAGPAMADPAVRHFTEPVEEFDQQGFLAALRAGQQPDPSAFKKQITKHYFVTVRDGEGLIVGDRALLEAPRKPGARMRRTLKGDVTAGCRVPSLLSRHEKTIGEQQQALRALIQTGASRGGGQTGGEAALRRARMFASGIESVLAVAKQVEWIEAAVELDDGRLRARFGLRPVGGTLLARSLAAQSPAPLDAGVMSLLPADAAMLSCWHTAMTPETVEFYTQYLQPVLQAAAPTNSPAASASLADIIRENMEVHAGVMGMALASQSGDGSGFDMVQAYRVRDATRARAAQRKAATIGLQAVSGFVSGVGPDRVKYQANAAKHGGVEIDRIAFDFDAAVSPASSAAAHNLIGSNVVTHMAFAGPFGLGASGGRGEESIRRLIDLALKPSAKPAARPRFDAATAGFPKRLNGVFFMQVEDYFKIATSAMPAAVGGDGGKLHDLLGRLQADIAGFFTFAKEAATAEVVVPLDKLLDLSRVAPAQPPDR